MQISCPQCGKSLEAPLPLPARAQCPFCSAIFTPEMTARAAVEPPPLPPTEPASPFAPPASSFAMTPSAILAADQVRIPALGLMIAGILSLLWALFDLVFSIQFILGFQLGQPPQNLPPFLQNLVQPNQTQMIVEAVMDCLRLLACSCVIYGAMKMQRLESYGLAITGGILGMVPCITCCCFLGFPFGIWCLVVLNRPEVRAGFK